MKNQKKHNLMTNQKSLFILFILLSLCSLPFTAFAGVLGDANSDGKVDILDALLIARYSASLQPICNASAIYPTPTAAPIQSSTQTPRP